MKRTRHTDRTYRLIESWGWTDWWPVEIFNMFSGKKTDLFHIIDLLVLTRKGVVGIQVCGSDYSEHVRKIMEYEQVNTRKWLSTPRTRLFLIGWRKMGKTPRKGKRDMRKFYPRIARITLKKGRLRIHEFPVNKERKWTAGKF